METDHIPTRNWVARLRSIDSGKEHRVPVKGVTILEAAKEAMEEADFRFCWVVCVEVLE